MTAHQIFYRASTSTTSNTVHVPSTSIENAGTLEQNSDLIYNSASTAHNNSTFNSSASSPSTSNNNVPNLRRRVHKGITYFKFLNLKYLKFLGLSTSQAKSVISQESPDRKMQRVGTTQIRNTKKFSTSITKGHPLFKGK